MRNRSSLLAFLFLVSVLTGVAAADDKGAARREYMEGTRRYDLNDFGPALEAFKRAYLAYEDPAFLYNIAQCYRQLGDKPNAIKFYRSYLRKVPDAPNRNEVSSTISGLESAVAADRAKEPDHPPGGATTNPPPENTGAPASQRNVLTAAPPPQRTPVYKKWWLWTIVGVAAAGVATGIAVAVTSQHTENSFMPVTVSR